MVEPHKHSHQYSDKDGVKRCCYCDEPDTEWETAHKIIENLCAYLIEAHAVTGEYETSHQGDAATPGEAPESCSYCNAVDEAREFLASAGVDVSSLTPERRPKSERQGF